MQEEETEVLLESRRDEDWSAEVEKIQKILIERGMISADDDLIKNEHFWFVFLLYYRENIKTNTALLTEFPNLAAIDDMIQYIEESSVLNTFKVINNAEIDELTQVWRRRTFKQRVTFLQSLIKEPEQDLKYTFAVYYIDIDFFKKVNDEFGHDMGDVVLQVFAKVMQENSRSEDSVFRWGGEEFVVLKILKNNNLW
jgi:GGDEF domain-containing protein